MAYSKAQAFWRLIVNWQHCFFKESPHWDNNAKQLELMFSLPNTESSEYICWYVTSKKVWPHFVGYPPPQLCHFASTSQVSTSQYEQVPYKARVLEQRQSKSSSKMILELSCLLSPDLWCDPQTYLPPRAEQSMQYNQVGASSHPKFPCQIIIAHPNRL